MWLRTSKWVYGLWGFENIKLVDGGIRENVPWKELKFLGADKVVNIVFEDEENEVEEKESSDITEEEKETIKIVKINNKNNNKKDVGNKKDKHDSKKNEDNIKIYNVVEA